MAWSLRTLSDAAYIVPDNRWEKDYFREKLDTVLAHFETKVLPGNPFGYYGLIARSARPDECMDDRIGKYAMPWQNDFLALAFDHALDQGFTAAKPSRDWLLGYTVGRFTNGPEFNPFDGATYRLAALDTNGNHLDSFGEIWANTFAKCGGNRTSFYDHDCTHGYPYIARAALSAAARDSLPGGPEAFQFLDQNLTGACHGDSPTWAIDPYWTGQTGVERTPRHNPAIAPATRRLCSGKTPMRVHGLHSLNQPVTFLPGTGSLAVFSLSGSKLLEIEGGTAQPIRFTHSRSGWYLYRIDDARGNPVESGRFLHMR
jgi:hypothetical protein